MFKFKYCIFFVFVGPLLNSHLIKASPTDFLNYNEPLREGVRSETSKVPKINQIQIKTNINDHFAQTTVVHRIENVAYEKQEAEFSVFLPENALVSGFILEIGGNNYTAYVEEKDESDDEPQIVVHGFKPPFVVIEFRDSFEFTVSVSVEANTKAAFYLTYEELLVRKDDQYELVTNINPRQLVEDLSVEVTINGSIPISVLNVPLLRSGAAEISELNADLDPMEDTVILSETEIIVRFSPSVERQKQLNYLLKTNENDGFSGQFIVQFDVESSGVELLLHNGYFAHFFAPLNFTTTFPFLPFPKHIVFVLDTSSTMNNENLEQAVQALGNILEQLHDNDVFSIVEMKSDVKIWNLYNLKNSLFYRDENDPNIGNYDLAHTYVAKSNNIEQAQRGLSNLFINGRRDIYTTLKVALNLADKVKRENLDGIDRQPLIMFITSSDLTPEEISREVTSRVFELNSASIECPIFPITFGTEVNEFELQKLSLQNYGFAKHIYEAGDAHLQIEQFFKQISSPIFKDITFNYDSSVDQVTKSNFPTYFHGSDLIVAGTYRSSERSMRSSRVDFRTVDTPVSLFPIVKNSTTDIERVWAHLTIKQLLEELKVGYEEDKEVLKNKAVELSLKYSLVTDVTSLVVEKPTSVVRTDSYALLRSMLRRPSNRNTAHVARPRPRPLYRNSPGGRRTRKDHLKSDLLSKISWLKSKLDGSGTLNLSSGKYKLGLNETITDRPLCPKTPLNTVGHCTLLKDCPHVLSLLINSDLLVEHFCVLKNEYAGICCPNV